MVKFNENRILEIKESVNNTVKNKDEKVRVRNYSMELSGDVDVSFDA